MYVCLFLSLNHTKTSGSYILHKDGWCSLWLNFPLDFSPFAGGSRLYGVITTKY